MGLLSDLIPNVCGRPVVVMGGAPSLPDDVERVAHDDCVYISANQHGLMLRDCDYSVYVDPVHQVTGERMQEKLSAFGVPTISPVFGADYRIPNWDSIGFKGNCGLHAIWVAYLLGASAIIVCGIECYQGGTYWHDPKGKSSSVGRGIQFFEKRIAELKKIIDVSRVRVVSGHLNNHFISYDPRESFVEVNNPASVNERIIPCTVAHRIRIAKEVFLKGSRLDVTESEFIRYRGHLLPRGLNG